MRRHCVCGLKALYQHPRELGIVVNGSEEGGGGGGNWFKNSAKPRREFDYPEPQPLEDDGQDIKDEEREDDGSCYAIVQYLYRDSQGPAAARVAPGVGSYPRRQAVHHPHEGLLSAQPHPGGPQPLQLDAYAQKTGGCRTQTLSLHLHRSHEGGLSGQSSRSGITGEKLFLHREYRPPLPPPPPPPPPRAPPPPPPPPPRGPKHLSRIQSG
jgi:hypothetical protein